MKLKVDSNRILIYILAAALLISMSLCLKSHAEEEYSGLVPVDINVSTADSTDTKAGKYSIINEASIPERYSSLDEEWFPSYIKSKNQGQYPICYAFAATSTAEISYSKETGSECIQTSPGHLAWYGYNTVTDPLGLTYGDGITLEEGTTAWKIGGATIWTMLEMSRGIGLSKADEGSPVLPASMEYEYSSGAYSNIALSLENSDYIEKGQAESDDSFRTRVKQAIMEYGGVDASMYYIADGYDSSKNSYIYSGTSISNHGIVIVGWDDTYSGDNFKDAPSGDGAWIVQNSWGEKGNLGTYDRGTFYVSYYDSVLLADGAWTFDMFGGRPYTERYQYDGGVSVSGITLEKGRYGANIYSVKDDEDLKLEAVSFTSYTEGTVKYDIEIYSGVEEGKPVSGTKVSSLTGVKTEHAGYHTFKLSSPVILSSGTRFSIVVKPYGSVDIATDCSEEGDEYDITSSVDSGQSFVGSSSFCYDLAEKFESCFRIKGLGNIHEAYDISGESITVDAVSGRTYTGSEITPDITVKYNGEKLVKDTDYTVAYSDNTNVGTATAALTGIGEFTGSRAVSFKILPASIEDAVSSVTPSECTYDGNNHEPIASAVFGGKELKEGTDYTVEYIPSDAYSNGYREDTVKITGIGNFTGVKELKVKVYQADIDTAEIVLSKTEYIYEGKEVEPEPAVSFNGKTLKKNSDYMLSWKNNIQAGTASVTVSGIGNFTGSKTLSYTIRYDLANAVVKLDTASYYYQAKDIEPKPEVAYSGTVLSVDTDYTLTWSNNKDSGEASVTVKGKGYYTGTVSKSFTILPKPVSQVNMDISGTAYTYSGSPVTPDIALSNNGVSLTKDTDYTVEYSSNINAGEAAIKITGIGTNYTGTKTLTFNISKCDISKDNSGITATLTKYKYQYTGNSFTPSPEVIFGGKKLEAGTDYRLEYSGNIDAGTATIKIIGIGGNYTGTKEVNFEISPEDMSKVNASISSGTYVYTGSEIKPVPAVKFGGKKLVEGTDYRLEYSGNIDAGTATVKIIGLDGNYTGTKELTFVIKSVDMSKVDASISSGTYVYTGSEIKPEPAVKFGEKKLVGGTDYRLEYSSNINVGTATIKIIGLDGNYSGTKELTFKISPADMSKVDASISLGPYVYTGSEIKPEPAVKFGEKKLVEGTDYRLEYSGNIDAGTATVKIIGLDGNYTGTRELNFEISPADMSKVNASISSDSYVYTGSEIKPEPAVKFGGKKLEEGTDYRLEYSGNIDAGTATIKIIGLDGNYTGTKELNFDIVLADISKAVAELPSVSYMYSGKEYRPVPSVKCGEKTLIEGTDYTVAYMNNVNAGSAKVVITGTGAYSGTLEVNFGISPADMSKVDASISSDSYVYTGSGIKPEPAVKFGGKKLEEGTDYRLEYIGNIDAGTATIKIIGLDGNYSGTKELTFKISPADMSNVNASISLGPYVYTGSEIRPEPAVKFGGKKLVEGTDYSVSYSNNINAGTAYLVIKGKGCYSGTRTIKFTIKPLDITKMTLSAASFVYDGTIKYPKVSVFQGSNMIASSVTAGNSKVDITMSLKKSVPGTYTVLVKGKGNYTGSLSKTYRICVKPAAISSLTAKSKGFTVKCSQLTSKYVTGYQVRYSTSSSMTSAKTVTIGTKASAVTKTISKLKAKKTYYVQVRSYKKINGRCYYSDWSAKKSVKTK